MKQTLLAFALASAGALSISAAELPDALYMVGTMNEWTSPAAGGTEYTLTKKRLTYTGEFDLPAGNLSFKIFSKIADWDDTQAYFGAFKNGYMIFDDQTLNLPLYTSDNGGGCDVWIRNWKGGKLSVTARYVGDGSNNYIILDMKGSDQPPFMEDTPEYVYMVGEFNGWQLPTESSDNGALRLAPSINEDAKELLYKGDAQIPAGKADFVFYYKNPDTGTENFLGTNCPPFAMTCTPGLESAVFTDIPLSGTSANDVSHYRINNWTGGTLNVSLDYYADRQTVLTWEDAPEAELRAPLNVIYETKDGSRYIKETQDLYGGVVLATPGEYGNITSILYTTENSLTPSADHVWGAPADSDQIIKGNVAGQAYSIVKGGKPYRFELNNMSMVKSSIDGILQIVRFSTVCPPDFNDLEQIYVVGYQNDWQAPIAANEESYSNYALKKVADYVFEGTIECPASDSASFRFFSELGGWDSNYSLGADMPDFYDVDTFFDNGVYTGRVYNQGMSNWKLAAWNETSSVKMTVDLNNFTVTFRNLGTGGIEIVEADGSDNAEWYNIQGMRVSEPTRGLYIRVSGGVSEKVIVK